MHSRKKPFRLFERSLRKIDVLVTRSAERKMILFGEILDSVVFYAGLRNQARSFALEQ